MKRQFKTYLYSIFFFSFLLSSNYETLLLIEFDNISKSKKYDYLRHTIPDRIKINSISNDINIEYAGKIEPFLNFDDDALPSILLLVGEYWVEDGVINVSYGFFDLKSWDKVYSGNFSYNTLDIEYAEHIIDKSFSEGLNIIFNGEKQILKSDNNLKDIPIILNNRKANEFENIYIALDDFAIEADLHFSWEKMNKEGNQYGTRYYKDFDKEEQKDLISNSKEENTKKLLAYIDKILLNPYDVNIGSISINYSDMNEEYVVMKIPVSYSIKNNLIEDLLRTLPSESKSSKGGTVSIKFDDKYFLFPKQFVDKFSLTKYQVIPVLFFSNDDKKLKNVFIDHWEEFALSNHLDLGDSDIDSNKEFYPLFSIIPGKNNLQISLDLDTINILYTINIHSKNIDEYSKIAIKFLLESEIKELFTSYSQN